jgi:hypothetical protein
MFALMNFDESGESLSVEVGHNIGTPVANAAEKKGSLVMPSETMTPRERWEAVLKRQNILDART